MNSSLVQLGQLLLDSIPTIIIFVLLHFYLKRVLYRPLRQVLEARRARIQGRLEAAGKLAAAAESKLLGYEEALRQKRVESYRHIESRRQAALAAGQQALSEARHDSSRALVQARQQLAGENKQARTQMQSSAEALANQIIAQVLADQSSRAVKPGVGA